MSSLLPLDFELSAIVLFLFLFFGIVLMLVIAFWNKKLELQTVLFLLLLLQASIWAGVHFAAFIFIDPNQILLIVKLSTASAIFVPVVFLHFVVLFTETISNSMGKILLCLYFIPLMFFPFSFTQYAVNGFAGNENNYRNVIIGPLYDFFIIYFLVYILSALILLLKDLKHIRFYTRKKMQTYFLLIGFIIPASFALVNNAIMPAWLDIYTPPNIGVYGMIISFVTLFYSVVRLRFLDVHVIVSKKHFYLIFLLLYTGVVCGMIAGISVIVKNLEYPLYILCLASTLTTSVIIFLLIRDRVIRFIDRYYFIEEIDFSKYIPEGSHQLNADHELESFVMRQSGFIQEIIEGPVLAFYVLQQHHNNYTNYFLRSGDEVSKERVENTSSRSRVLLIDDVAREYGEGYFMVRTMKRQNAKLLVEFVNTEGELIGFVLVGAHKNGIAYSEKLVRKLEEELRTLDQILMAILNWQLSIEALRYKMAQE